jgi:hypothetical protein
MNEDATSLDRLHDIVPPAAVPWWPPAPGWYVVLAIILIIAAVFAVRAWRRWWANAYRRQALRELASAPDAATIASLLRRTALAESPRPEIACLGGDAWLEWLSKRSPEPMPAAVREGLMAGVYNAGFEGRDTTALRAWAARWIKGHRCIAVPSQRTNT